MEHTSVDETEEPSVKSPPNPPKQYPCPYCTAVFKSANQLKRHKQRHKKRDGRMPEIIVPSNETAEANFTEPPPTNDPLITEVELLLEDDSFFKRKTPITCDLCPSTFTCQSRLNDHMLKHTGERPFKCPLCDKSYPLKGKSV